MSRKTKFIPYKTRSILNKHKRSDHWFWTRYTAYPYIGCQHGCEFCYCREKKYSPYEEIGDFPFVIKVKENAPLLLRKALTKVPKDVIAVGDYQPVEKKFEISRKMLEICLEMDFPVFILERSPLVLRDLDLLQEINKRTHVSVLFSIIHTSKSPHSDRISAMERLAPSPELRFNAMEKFASLGFQTGICFMPIIPGLCDTRENINLVIKQCIDHGGQFALAAPLTMADQQRTYFLTYLKEHEVDLYDLHQRLYPPRSYGPSGRTWLETALLVRELCNKSGIRDRMPRPIFTDEKRALNKQAVEYLADELYTMELSRAPDYKMWAFRKAAWSVEDLKQDIGLVYKRMGLKGLESIQHVGPAIGKKLEQIIIEHENKSPK
jgi:DNA repair photolyase